MAPKIYVMVNMFRETVMAFAGRYIPFPVLLSSTSCSFKRKKDSCGPEMNFSFVAFASVLWPYRFQYMYTACLMVNKSVVTGTYTCLIKPSSEAG